MKKLLLLLTVSSLFLIGCTKTHLHNDSDQTTIALNVSSGQTKSIGGANSLLEVRSSELTPLELSRLIKKMGKNLLMQITFKVRWIIQREA